ncbi:MAG: GNAT family N-acetyltransferase [Clostridia bacterium]|nr:GNAT family N-acetyltransferase [Clostridia bacterium]
MKIAPAEKEQAEQIVELLRYICEIHGKGRPDIFVPGASKYGAEDVLKLIEDEKTRLITATQDGEVLGYLIAKLQDAPSGPHLRRIRTFYIDDLCVKPDRRGTGVGAALFSEAKRIAEELGCDRIDLNVWAFNEDAIKFYRKMGLTVSRMHMEMKL